MKRKTFKLKLTRYLMHIAIPSTVLVISIGVFLIHSHETYAQNKAAATRLPVSKQFLKIDPAIVDTQANPGQTSTIIYTIENVANFPLGIHMSVEGFDASDEINGISFVPPNQTILSGWSQFSDTDFILPEGTTKRITLTVQIPRNVKQQGYYGIVFFKPFITTPLDLKKPQVTSKIGTLLLLTVGTQNAHDLERKISLLDFSIDKSVRGDYDASVRIKNDYFTHFLAKPIVKVSSLFGNQTKEILTEKRILPGKIRLWHEPINLPSGFPIYTADVSIRSGFALIQKRTIIFGSIFQYGIEAIIFFLGFLLAWIGRYRIVRAFSILFKQSKK